MHLTSERLKFHACTEADLEYFLDLAMREEVMRFITGRALTREEATERFANNLRINREDPSYGFFIALSKEDGSLAGYAKLVKDTENEYEAGYSLHPGFWGKGYATEILGTLIDYASKDPAIRSLMAKITPENNASRRVLEKKNFVSYLFEKGESGDTEYFRLTLRP
ncbi:GNAT family N-acetyltransferase [Emticicia sp. CRIBPO]|uniref:GNAT family N-acetyltransferase n=1 Tax=Emticicia sp. CRIBPO TaxID=2683258 RepID=UPI001412B4FD|nr:GNAT family N-acetyltransferase [Emticicia sp. CRIBPO]NBA87805.1 GNAT family N-acetyltransferase [Emticicia sp. CRIBPO]